MKRHGLPPTHVVGLLPTLDHMRIEVLASLQPGEWVLPTVAKL